MQLIGHPIEEDGISVISCNGISYEKYLAIAKGTGKRIAVITDNDKKTNNITKADESNRNNELQHIFMGATIEDWTWEICVYNVNKAALDKMITVQAGADYLFHGNDYGKVAGKMLNNKVDVAYQMLMSGKVFEVPQYIRDAVKWINE